MTTVTFLGASGGTGTTTLAALTLHLLATHSIRLPAVAAADTSAFGQRSGLLLPPAPAGGHQLIDGGRYDEHKAATALAHGYLVLVGALTPAGITALDTTLVDIATRSGDAVGPRILPVLSAAYGRRRAVHDAPVQMRLPFDGALAAGGSLSVAMPRLNARTRATLAQRWTPWVLETYAPS